ncbi:unnamed protein product [Didymodactylos carnosus]|uniref:Cytochrome P450 n=1 Tax=Didymodactylos carnosus TaxID=1234261 RepID=A0A8S2HA17_9BILA|nr:unnamed protein product [Didymodactylos carnosus]CAF3621234.1 unnamed protein product [Didymodactylos carnosus]
MLSHKLGFTNEISEPMTLAEIYSQTLLVDLKLCHLVQESKKMISFPFVGIIIILTPIVVYILNLFRKHAVWKKAYESIPSPPCVPLMGNLHLLSSERDSFLRLLMATASKYSEQSCFCIWYSIWPIVVLTNADGLEIFFSSTKEITKSFEYKLVEPWLKTGLLTSKGNKWRTRRRILTPSFHDANLLQSFLIIFNEQSRICTSRFETLSEQPIDMYPFIAACTLDIICEAAMGTSCQAQVEKSEYVEAVARIGDIIVQRMTTPWMWPNFLFKLFPIGREHEKLLKILHDFSRNIINNRAQQFGGNQLHSKRMAFLDTLLAKMHDEQLTMEDIQEEVDTFMFEGHDTTAAALNFACFLIALHPDVQQKLHDEINRIFQDDLERACSMDDLKQMNYLECVIKESLRLLPSVPSIGREAQEDLTYNGHKILAGQTCYILIKAIHLDPKYFPEPNKFNPDRFLPENSAQHSHHFAFVPFSAGTRNCIGQRFAMLEEKVFLSTLLRKFSLTTTQTIEDIRLAEEIIMRAVDPIYITLKRRR